MVYCSGSSGSRQKRSWNGLQKILGLTCFVDATRLYARSAKRTITGVAWRKRQFFAFAFYFNITRSSELSPHAHPAFETAWDCLHFSFIFTICQCFPYQYFPVCTPTIDFGQTHTLIEQNQIHFHRRQSSIVKGLFVFKSTLSTYTVLKCVVCCQTLFGSSSSDFWSSAHSIRLPTTIHQNGSLLFIAAWGLFSVRSCIWAPRRSPEGSTRGRRDAGMAITLAAPDSIQMAI